MYNYAVKRIGNGFTMNCVCLNNDLKAYAITNDSEKTYNFKYTGKVQEITLQPGKYKLLCWGALGGGSGSSAGASVGARGGYSEGVLTLNTATTLYVFVGGEGSDNFYPEVIDDNIRGGWNGGGGLYFSKYWGTDGGYKESIPAAGGGGTDIATVTSSMNYGSGVTTQRSDASLLSRFIVAGGGAGASVAYSGPVDGTISNRYRSNGSQVGGGRSGNGYSPGTQTGPTSFFGEGESLGGSPGASVRPFVSGAGGGGWYGGGCNDAATDDGAINDSGGGSGFVNTAANAASRPSGYSGLLLDSGFTQAGNTSFPSPSGGNETGHSGNGYVRITVLKPDESSGGDTGGGTEEDNKNITWYTKSGVWNESSNPAAIDKKQFTCVSPGSDGQTVISCTFSGVTSITFKCRYQGEGNYDYLTVGKLDTTCTRTSYSTSLKGKSGTWNEITYTCDSNTHFVQFCYSKDSSVDTSPDNADVYISKCS